MSGHVVSNVSTRSLSSQDLLRHACTEPTHVLAPRMWRAADTLVVCDRLLMPVPEVSIRAARCHQHLVGGGSVVG